MRARSVRLIVLLSLTILVPTSLLVKTNSSTARNVVQAGTQGDFSMQIQPNQFLMRTTTTATPSIVFTPMNGFVGYVYFTGTVSPVGPYSPTISMQSSIYLNSSIPGSPTVVLTVSTTASTPAGLYNINITSVSGTLQHTATATVGVTVDFVPGNSSELVYRANTTLTGQIGGSAVFTFTAADLGYYPIGINRILVNATTVGAFSNCFPPPFVTCAPWVNLQPYQQKNIQVTVSLAPDLKPGKYPFTATIDWEVAPLTLNQNPGPEIVLHGEIIAVAPPFSLTTALFNNLATFLVPILTVQFATAGVSIILVDRHEKKKQRALMDTDLETKVATLLDSS